MYYIYEHKTLTGEIFYIGKGTVNKKNSYGGYSRAYSKSNRTKKWLEIANKGYTISIIIESENIDYILDQENKLWEDCKSCVNIQATKKFKDYSIKKVNNDVAVLYVFSKTYLIFKTGEVYNYIGNKLNLSLHNNDYYILTVSKGIREKKNFYVHRLVAEAFIDNPENLPNVNHLNLNRKDNSISNLAWCTQKMNVDHSVNLGSYKFKEKIKKVLQFDEFGNFIKEWDRAKSVSTHYNCTEELIQQACQQKNIQKAKKAKKFIWIYKEDYENNIRDKFNLTIKT